MRQEEYRHFAMLYSVIEQLSGDPTAVTPSANLQATAGHGINKVIVDPRTTLLQSLEAILVAELADNARWEALIELQTQLQSSAGIDLCGIERSFIACLKTHALLLRRRSSRQRFLLRIPGECLG